jgi:hypothetical protein
MASIHKNKTSTGTSTGTTGTTGTNAESKDAMAAWRRELRRRSEGGFKSRDALEVPSRSWRCKWS